MIESRDRRPFVYRPTDAPWQVRYIDERVLIVDKPEGLLSVPGRAESDRDCLITRVQTEYPEVLLVHRLDLATSGLIVFARDREAQGALSKSFQHRRVVKRYAAVVHGHLGPSRWVVDQPMRVDWPRRPVQIVDRVAGKPARTDIRSLGHTARTPSPESAAGDRPVACTPVALVPHTGRTHQLRVHMQWLGHPILGDSLYAPPWSAAAFGRLHLHAALIIVPHPTTGLPIRVTSPAPF
jgi:tRNA pseudouridine32 synthase/23S rRNA pseudouridine746 synthase